MLLNLRDGYRLFGAGIQPVLAELRAVRGGGSRSGLLSPSFAIPPPQLRGAERVRIPGAPAICGRCRRLVPRLSSGAVPPLDKQTNRYTSQSSTRPVRLGSERPQSSRHSRQKSRRTRCFASLLRCFPTWWLKNSCTVERILNRRRNLSRRRDSLQREHISPAESLCAKRTENGGPKEANSASGANRHDLWRSANSHARARQLTP